ncbi:MAG: enoyl-CoA hydratase-related protein [Hyphomonadaceae bacterium]
MPDHVKTQREGRLLIVTLDRPEVLNSFNAAMNAELNAAFEAFEADPDLWIAILTGAGDHFCAGHDISEELTTPDETFYDAFQFNTKLTKPVIAAVNGYALGGGWEIAMACDIIVADERASFGLTEPRVGFAALGGGAYRLALQIPKYIAMGYLLTGARMSAAEAHKWGAVTEVAPAGEMMAAARRWAEDILKCAPVPVRYTKRLARAALEPRAMLDEVLPLNTSLAEEMAGLADTREGMEAFLAKRKPVWKGR